MSRPKDNANSLYDVFNNNPQTNRTQIAERMYLRLLTEWAATRFNWTGLPDSIDSRFLEMELCFRSLVVFYEDPNVGQYLAVRGASWGEPNMYDNPTKFYTVSIGPYKGVRLTSALNQLDYKNGGNHVTSMIGEEDPLCVPIWGTYSRMPSRDVVMLYARRLADLDVSLEVNAKLLRNSRLIAAPEGQRLTWTNLLRQVDEGQPAIFGTDDLNQAELNVFDIGANPQNLDSLRLEKNQVWNEAMTLLGITNSNQDKKERLVAAEAIGTNGQVMAAREAAIKPRKEAAEAINRIYGLNVDVEWALVDPVEVGEEIGGYGDSEDSDSVEVGEE